MLYRLANQKDIEAIALLHAQSWQKHYRGIFSDDFLDNQVIQNRLEVWEKRLTYPTDNQRVIVAEENQILQGLVCVLGEEDTEWGALVDNLHARTQGKGIGRILLSLAANWVKKTYPDAKMHLWVLEKNEAAIQFYEKMKGKNVETILEENPGGGFASIIRYAWEDLVELSQVAIKQNINVSN